MLSKYNCKSWLCARHCSDLCIHRQSPIYHGLTCSIFSLWWIYQDVAPLYVKEHLYVFSSKPQQPHWVCTVTTPTFSEAPERLSNVGSQKTIPQSMVVWHAEGSEPRSLWPCPALVFLAPLSLSKGRSSERNIMNPLPGNLNQGKWTGLTREKTRCRSLSHTIMHYLSKVCSETTFITWETL